MDAIAVVSAAGGNDNFSRRFSSIMTERLYYNDSHLTDFGAQVVAIAPYDETNCAVVLDRTAFYPTSGGQPHDTGTIALAANPERTARVVDCIDTDESKILHIVSCHEAQKFQIGAPVVGHIDRARRFDHLQQHTAQHILSQAFVKLFNAETRGFRMFAETSEIDVALASPSPERINDAVALANRIVWEDRPLQIIYATPEEAKNFNLRKESKREGILRLIEIENFDTTPCGGTHAKRTGEVGTILVRSFERAKGMTRVEFVAGARALRDYNRANETAQRIAALFSVARDDSLSAVARLFDENKTLARRLREQSAELARHEASELLALAPQSEDKLRVVVRVFTARDTESLNALARALVAHRNTIVLLASEETNEADEKSLVSVRLVFARSVDVNADMNALMREICARIGGRGGGRPDFAQGGGQYNAQEISTLLDKFAARFSNS